MRMEEIYTTLEQVQDINKYVILFYVCILFLLGIGKVRNLPSIPYIQLQLMYISLVC
jgi:hypothetical protein